MSSKTNVALISEMYLYIVNNIDWTEINLNVRYYHWIVGQLTIIFYVRFQLDLTAVITFQRFTNLNLYITAEISAWCIIFCYNLCKMVCICNPQYRLLIISFWQRIHEVQELMANTEAWNRIGVEQQQARSRQLTADERQCRSVVYNLNL